MRPIKTAPEVLLSLAGRFVYPVRSYAGFHHNYLNPKPAGLSTHPNLTLIVLKTHGMEGDLGYFWVFRRRDVIANDRTICQHYIMR